MTWTKVGTNAGGTVSFAAWTNTAINDLRFCEILNFVNKTVYVSTLTGGGCTWVPVGTKLGVNTNYTASMFVGTETATGAFTPSLTWSGTAPTNWGYASQMFHTTVGSWYLDKFGSIDSLAGQNSWASLTPNAAGELYWGYAATTAATAGTTTGYTYNITIDGASNGCAYNVACPASATFPVWGDAGHQLGMMALIGEGSAPGGRAAGRSRLALPPARRIRAVTYGR